MSPRDRVRRRAALLLALLALAAAGAGAAVAHSPLAKPAATEAHPAHPGGISDGR